MAAKYLQLETQDGVSTLTLNRPPANALDLEFTRELAEVWESLELGSHTRCLIVTGQGSCFSAGLDLRVLGSYSVPEQDLLLREFNRLALAAYGFRRPTIAAVNGHAIAGGLIVALWCDYRIGPRDTGAYGLTEGQVGVAFPAGAMVPAVHELRPDVSRRLMLGAQTYGAGEALADGVFDELTEPGEVMARAQELARQRRELPASYGHIKHQIRRQGLDTLRAAVRHGDPLEGHWLPEDIEERVQARLKK